MKFHLTIDKEKEEEVFMVAREHSRLTQQIEQLVLAYNGSDRICAYTEDEMKMLKFSDIECITVIGGKAFAIDTSAKRYRLKQRLYELEELLPSYFIRINKSALANEHRLECFSASFNGAVDAIFKCGYREYVSRRCLASIKRRFEKS